MCYLKINLTFMKSFFRIFYMLTISLCFCNCSNHDTKSNEVVAARQPDFVDNGKAVDSLKKVYSCESIEYDNWKDNDASDSCLTVCLINSNKVVLSPHIAGWTHESNYKMSKIIAEKMIEVLK